MRGDSEEYVEKIKHCHAYSYFSIKIEEARVIHMIIIISNQPEFENNGEIPFKICYRIEKNFLNDLMNFLFSFVGIQLNFPYKMTPSSSCEKTKWNCEFKFANFIRTGFESQN